MFWVFFYYSEELTKVKRGWCLKYKMVSQVCVLPVVWWPFVIPGIFLHRQPNKGHRKSHWSQRPWLAGLQPGPLDLETQEYPRAWNYININTHAGALEKLQTYRYIKPIYLDYIHVHLIFRFLSFANTNYILRFSDCYPRLLIITGKTL